MTDEQINEVMRLVRDAVVTNSLFATEQIADMSIVGEAKCALVSYLRTIGEPENTFPLNPNGAGISAMSVARFSTDTGRIDPWKPSRSRSRGAKLSPAKRVMKKAQAQRKKGGAA